MHALVTQVHPLIQIRRSRKLDFPGTVLVRVGQKVSPSDILAESEIPMQHHVIDVFRALGTRTPQEAEKLIDRKVGDELDKHDIIAETGGLFSRVIRAPMPGRIVFISNGQILLETASKKVTVQSGLSGSVVEIIKDRGAIIEAQGMLVQGLWGNEKIGFGPFLVDAETIEKELTPDLINLEARGGIIAASSCTQAEALTTAAALPITGLILGSMSPELINIARKQPYPILLLEGFGRVGINEVTKKLLVSNARREVSLIADKWDRYTGSRPEVIISLPAQGDVYREMAEFAQGQVVRAHAVPYVGTIGRIEELPSGLSTLPNGIKTTAAAVKFINSNENVLIPLSNLDIIDLENRFLGKSE